MSAKPKLRVILCSPRGFCAGVDARHRRRRARAEAATARRSMSATRSSTTNTWSNALKAQGRGLRRGARRGAGRRRAGDLLRPRRAASRCRPRRQARNLFAIDATCPLVTKVHREAERALQARPPDHADRPCRPSGGGRHHGPAAAGRDHAGRRPRRRRGARRPGRARQPRLRHPDDAVGRRHPRRWSRRCAGAFPQIAGPPHEDICYATTNRQEAVKAAAHAGRRADRRRRRQFLELPAPARGRRARRLPGRALVPRADGARLGAARRRALGRDHRRRLGAGGPGRGDHRRLRRALRARGRDADDARGEHVLPAAARACASRPGCALMAVYTEVTDDELAAFLGGLRPRRAAVLQGHRRGRRELQLPAGDRDAAPSS